MNCQPSLPRKVGFWLFTAIWFSVAAGWPDASRLAASAEPGAGTRIGVRASGFTVNDAPVFLLGCSYYGGLGGDAKTWQADLDDMERAGFNWVRVWATWGAFGRDVSAVDADGRPRDPYLDKLKSLVAECDRRGIVVDMTLSRGNGSTGPARLQSQEAHRRAVETLVTALKSWRNWYLDLANERNIRDARFVGIEELKELRDRVRELDPARIVTASHGGDLSADDLRKYEIDAALDFVAPHRPRDNESPGQTEGRTREWIQAMEALGRVVPVHYQEPFRRGYPGYSPVVPDYQTDLRGAIDGGAAGWCFHNGSSRGAVDEQPRRSFDLSEKRLFAQLDAVELDAVRRFRALVPRTAGPLRVRHTRLADLGGEHVAHAIFRHTPAGGAIVGWGERILEWPLDKPALHEAMPRLAGFEYSNGGCALDVDGDATDEIVVARGRTRSCSDPDLLWFKETGDGKFWTEHQIGNIGRGSIAPHDIQPFSARQPDGGAIRGVVAVIDRRQLVWYHIPDDPTRPWPRLEIAELPLSSQSGIAVGNLAGNDRSDVACGMFWAECPADPIRDSWKVRRFGHWEDGGWGGMAKLELADMNGDGRLEIVATEAEIPEARLGIFFRDPQHLDAVWKCREIEAGLYCPHSLVLADLDGDSLTDIVIGEMTAGGWSFPLNPKPRILAFLNRGHNPFDRYVLAEGQGVHEMGLVPNRRDGAWVVFAADEIQPQKLPDMKTHVSCWKIESPTANRSSAKP
ncbi:MAG TPA: hypothetical protein VND64_03885 [Pirellulales bacterium]|nr:hypothetical protein [Pirellulales bacterium]